MSQYDVGRNVRSSAYRKPLADVDSSFHRPFHARRTWPAYLKIGLALTAMIFVVSWWPGLKPNAVDLGHRLAPPGFGHWLGTDAFGRDLLARTLRAGRVALSLSVFSSTFALFIGVLFGTIAGYVGGWLDEVISRVNDALTALPGVLLAMLLVTVYKTGFWVTALAIGLGLIPTFVRLSRVQALSLRERPYVEAARALGARTRRIIFVHILPNLLGPVLAQLSIAMAIALLAEAGLAYLGLGSQPPNPSWGRMLKEAQGYLGLSLWPALVPGAALVLSVFSLNLIGLGLQRFLQPKSPRKS